MQSQWNFTKKSGALASWIFVFKKINCLRTVYEKELAKVNGSSKLGSGTFRTTYATEVEMTVGVKNSNVWTAQFLFRSVLTIQLLQLVCYDKSERVDMALGTSKYNVEKLHKRLIQLNTLLDR